MKNKKKIAYLLCFLILPLSIKHIKALHNTKDKKDEIEITKVVIPAAGFGTRFLPFTKSVPKEMIPILNKPSIQYSVEECIQSGINNFFIITGKTKAAIENYFDPNKELDLFLTKNNKIDRIDSIKNICKKAHFTYVRQPEALGLGHAVLMAKHCIADAFFSVLLPDDIIIGNNPCIGEMIKIAKRENASVIAVQEVPLELVSSYGVVSIKKEIEPGVFEISSLVEKPKREDAPSNLAIVGRYVLSHNIFTSLETIMEQNMKHNIGEIQLTDGINHLAQQPGEKIIAYKIKGTRYDTGRPISWLEANISAALSNPEYAEKIKEIFFRLIK